MIYLFIYLRVRVRESTRDHHTGIIPPPMAPFWVFLCVFSYSFFLFIIIFIYFVEGERKLSVSFQ